MASHASRLGQSERQELRVLREAFDGSPIAIGILDADLRYVMVNGALADLIGIAADACAGRSAGDIGPDTDPPLDALLEPVASNGGPLRSVVARLLGGDGDRPARRIAVTAQRYAAGRDGGLLLTLADWPVLPPDREPAPPIRTARGGSPSHISRVESAELAARLDTIIGDSPIATVLLDRDLTVRLWNRSCEAMFGWTEEEVLGRPLAITPPDLGEEFDDIRRRTLRGESVLGRETRRIRRDGTEIEVAVYDVPYRDASGEILGIVLRMVDISDRRWLEAQLLQAQKMESVGRLAGGVAHDFNNILTAIIGHAELALLDMPPYTPGRENVAAIRASAERASGLTQQLLAFSRRQILALQDLDVNEVVLSLEVLLRRLIGDDIELAISVDPRAGSIRGDPTQLQQVLLNLAVNARDAMPDGGRLVIRTERVVFDEAYVARHLDVSAGDYAMIAVSDTGIGMDEETRAHIFEPFFTTKDPGKGTGLGLAMTHGVVRQSGGHIYFYSEPGHGTTFKLYFPSINISGDKAPAAPEPVEPIGHGTILVVEDEPNLRELARAVLIRRGYDLLVAATGAEALALAEAHPGRRIDLLISDVVMPGMRGPELAARLKVGRPELKVLLVSGYTEDTLDRGGGLHGAAFLAKPFTPQALARKVLDVLGPPPD